ncbi:hypothetical protein [Thiorhodovibrio frisius]|uniref:Uncharacterized protein n=1 Tax=Thiorhodovibrio frisius TaxID=631362 RepID=H8Z714_9GAMM|nr:hypothetical protein [Thiorhodovibrio frisius]EIC20813.1 hypothetical protein Thi970DRAFT_04476 [Thiorhodovibrio frisius]WPL21864.1 hypothetical protein Thiofri_02001 [Thiorhodovibrio frisius]
MNLSCTYPGNKPPYVKDDKRWFVLNAHRRARVRKPGRGELAELGVSNTGQTAPARVIVLRTALNMRARRVVFDRRINDASSDQEIIGYLRAQGFDYPPKRADVDPMRLALELDRLGVAAF